MYTIYAVCAADNESRLTEAHISAFVLKSLKGSKKLTIIQLMLMVCTSKIFEVL